MSKQYSKNFDYLPIDLVLKRRRERFIVFLFFIVFLTYFKNVLYLTLEGIKCLELLENESLKELKLLDIKMKKN